MSNTWRAAGQLALFDLAALLRNRRSRAALVAFGAVALVTAAFLTWLDGLPAQAMNSGFAGLGGGLGLMQLVAGKAPYSDDGTMRYPLPIPESASGFFHVLLVVLPLWIVITSAGLVNDDGRTHTSRFLLLRCSRTSLLLGRLGSHLAMLALLAAASNLVFFVLAWAALSSFSLSVTAARLALHWVYLVFYGGCFLCLTALVSSLVDSSTVSRRLLLAALIAPWILSFKSTWRGTGALWCRESGLLSAHPGTIVRSLVVYALAAGLFYGLTWLRVTRRHL